MPRKPKNNPNDLLIIENDYRGGRHDAGVSGGSSRSGKSTVEKPTFKQRWEAFITTANLILNDPKTRIISGLILCCLALVLLLSYGCYFFTGKEDFSILMLDKATRQSHVADIRNILGLPGAQLGEWLINDTFGLLSVIWAILSLVYGLILFKVMQVRHWRLLLSSLFAILWGSILLGFIQQVASLHLFFRLGGKVGETIAAAGIVYMHPVGMIIVLAVSFIIFCVLMDVKIWEKLLQRKKKEPEPVEVNLNIKDNIPAPVVEIIKPEVEAEEQPAAASSAVPVVEIIEPKSEEQPAVAAGVTPVSAAVQPNVETHSAADSGVSPTDSISIDIEETKAVELSEDDPDYLLKKLGPYDPRKDLSNYKFPSLTLLKTYDNETAPLIDQEEQQANARRIVETLRNYDVEVEKIHATIGPTVTLYEIVPKAGTRLSKIQSLENDIMMSLSAIGIRIIAPMPGKGTVGIEVPNEKPQVVSMHCAIASKKFQEETSKMKLPVAMGKTITNEVFCFDLAKTPHLLVAGATGQGKSVGLNAIITSLLYKKHPAELKFVLVDPKMVEFSIYKPLIKHYLAAMPDQEDRDIIITDCQKVINTLNSLVIEMEDRYSLLAEAGCRNLEDYNDKFVSRHLNPEKAVENVVTKKILHHHFMPYIVIIIDEYGDFIMQAGKEVERPIQRIAQKARAVGMHMILATQRPDVKIVTGTIKANIPTRIAFRTQSVVDSRTVLDTKGADQLIGKGDMLYSGGGNLTRIQCAFVDTPEVEAIVNHIHSQQGYLEPYQLPEYVPEGQEDAPTPGSVDTRHLDPMFADVARYVVAKQEGSTSRLQRAFEIGYNRAGKLSDQLEALGIVGPNKGPKGRDVLIQDPESLEKLLEGLA